MFGKKSEEEKVRFQLGKKLCDDFDKFFDQKIADDYSKIVSKKLELLDRSGLSGPSMSSCFTIKSRAMVTGRFAT